MDDAARRDHRLLARFRVLALVLVALFAVAELLAACAMTVEPLGAAIGPHGFAQFFAMALLGTFVLHLWCGPPRREFIVALVAGVAAEGVRALVCWRAGWDAAAIAAHTGFGAGLASLAVQTWFVTRARDDDRTRRLVVLHACLLIDGFVLLSNAFVSVTTPLHPLTLDGLVYAFDDTLGVQLSFVVGRLFRRLPALDTVAGLVYLATPFGFALIWAAQRRARERPPIDVMTAFLVASAAGFALYHAFPVVGPKFVADGWPATPPMPATLGLEPRLATPAPRNCVPSLHTTWVLLLWWHSRGRGPAVRVVAALFVVLTLLATLGLGLHYAVDLVMAVPFAVAAQAASSPPTRESRRALAVCAALVALWFALLRAGLLVRHPLPAVSWLLCLATVVTALWLERSAWLAAARATVIEPPLPEPAPGARRDRAVVLAMFGSGFAVLVANLVFAKQLSLAFGTTGRAATTVLGTYLGGVALGAWLGGRMGGRGRTPLRAFAACQGAIGVFCAASPPLMRGVRGAYVLLGGAGDPGRPSLAALQVLLSAAVLLPTAVLTGVTLPLLTRYFVDAGRSLGVAVGTVCGAGALGAGFAAVVSGFVLWPALGLSSTLWLAVAAHLIVAVVALRLDERGRAAPATTATSPTAAPATATPAAPQSGVGERRALPLVVVTAGGVVGLALVVAYLHLLTIVAGNTLYALALMLGCLFAALGAGATVMRRVLRDGLDATTALAWCQLGVAVCVLAGVFAWEQIPDYFASFGSYMAARTFGAREVVRFVVIAVVLAPVAACMGAAWPAALEWIGRGSPRASGTVGRAAALHTAGNVAGSILAASLFARLGWLRALELAAAAATLLGVVTALAGARGRRLVALAPLVGVVALAAAQPRALDPARLASGAHVYFAPPAERDAGDAAPARDAMVRLAEEHATSAPPAATPAAPPVATSAAGETLVVDAAAARDLRSRLLSSAVRYRAIVLAPTEIWTAGAATLYNRELYDIAAAALDDRGLVAQSFPLDRLAPVDFAAALASMHTVFPYMWLHLAGGRGVMIGCLQECPPGSGRPLLDTAGVDRLVAAAARATGQRPEDLVSTDDNLYLEQHTPRAAVRPYGPSLQMNLRWLRSFAAP